MEIVKVTTSNDLNEFIKLPYKLYKDDKNFIPPLLIEQKRRFSHKNPFFKNKTINLYIAKKEKETVGRIASIINHNHNAYHKDRTGFFGFFDSIDDKTVTHLLFDQVIKDMVSNHMDNIIGPMNFSTNEECGLLVEGYDEPPMIMMTYNFAYYHDLLMSYGFKKIKDLLAFVYTVQDSLPDKVYRVAAIAERRKVTIRYINKVSFFKDLMDFKEIYNDAWADNWGFVPISDEELEFIAKTLKPIANEKLAAIATIDNHPVGFLGVIPDINQVLRFLNGRLNPFRLIKAFYHMKRITQGRLMLFGIKKRFRNKGIDALLYREVHKGLLQTTRINRIEFSWILEDNIETLNLAQLFNGRPYKRYRLYQKEI